VCPLPSTAALALPLTGAALPARAVTCDELVASISERIRANGVAEFSVTAVDMAASAPGQQVGHCDAGRRKIMYVRTAAAAAAAPASGAPRARVITECADGRVIEGGTCGAKKPGPKN
jgi:hypothetical protein